MRSDHLRRHVLHHERRAELQRQREERPEVGEDTTISLTIVSDSTLASPSDVGQNVTPADVKQIEEDDDDARQEADEDDDVEESLELKYFEIVPLDDGVSESDLCHADQHLPMKVSTILHTAYSQCQGLNWAGSRRISAPAPLV